MKSTSHRRCVGKPRQAADDARFRFREPFPEVVRPRHALPQHLGLLRR